MLKPRLSQQKPGIKVKRQNLLAGVILCFGLMALLSCRNNDQARAHQSVGPADLIRLIDMSPVDYTAELNKIYAGWQFDPDKNRWVNTAHNSALAIREHELRLMEPVKYYEPYLPYFENHNFNLISISAPADTSKAGRKIFENTDYIFTIQTNEKYVMISLGNR